MHNVHEKPEASSPARSHWATYAGFGLTLTTLAVVGLIAFPNANSNAAEQAAITPALSNADSPDPLTLLSALSAPVDDSHTAVSLPAELDLTELGAGGIDPSSLRLAGETDNADIWVGLDAESNVCVLASLKSEYLVGGGCGPVSIFQSSGIGIGVQGGTDDAARYIEAYIVPDDAAVPEVDGLTQVAEGVLAGDTRAIANEPIAASRAGGEGGFALQLVPIVDAPPVD